MKNRDLILSEKQTAEPEQALRSLTSRWFVAFVKSSLERELQAVLQFAVAAAGLQGRDRAKAARRGRRGNGWIARRAKLGGAAADCRRSPSSTFQA